MKLQNLIKNKKGTEGEMYLSFWMFIIWGVTGVSIAIGIILFLSVVTDTRSIEANVLGDKLADCMIGNFNYSKISSDKFDIISACNFNNKVITNTDIYYFNVSIRESNSAKQTTEIIGGFSAYNVICELQQNKQEMDSSYPRCAFKFFNVIDKDTKREYGITITSASKQK